MVQEALGALTVGLAELPTRPGGGARPESSTESAFAEVLADIVHLDKCRWTVTSSMIWVRTRW
jgi:hypothetical protein